GCQVEPQDPADASSTAIASVTRTMLPFRMAILKTGCSSENQLVRSDARERTGGNCDDNPCPTARLHQTVGQTARQNLQMVRSDNGDCRDLRHPRCGVRLDSH